MRKTIILIIDTLGNASLETTGYAGRTCKDASKFLETALGKVTGDLPTTHTTTAQGETAHESN